MRTTEHFAYILSFSVMRSVSLRWNFQRISLRGFHPFGGHVGRRGTPSIFSFIVQHTETRNPDFSFALFPSSTVKCWTFAYPHEFHRECALPREGINLFCALPPSRSSAERDLEAVQKSTTRRAFDTTVAANGVTRGENTVTRELREEKRVGILHYSGIFRAPRPLNSPTLGQNRARCVRATS